MKLIRNLPNLLTLFNLFLGCMAIVYIFSDHIIIYETAFDTHNETVNIHLSNLDLAGYCILLAAIIDFFDGFVARILKAQSAIGKQLDSLADMVTFGLVPGLLLFNLLQLSYSGNNNAFDYPLLFFAAGFIVTLCAAVRLARFNLNEDESTEFRGLPTPSAAILVASLPFLMIRDEMGTRSLLGSNWFLIVLIAALSYLMVSNIRMMSLKIKSFSWKNNEWLFGLLGSELVLLIAGLTLDIKFLLIPLVIILYILFSFTKNIVQYGI